MNTQIISINPKKNDKGSLIAIESFRDLPFEINRIYYIYDVGSPHVRRGFHAHKRLQQLLICILGSVKILVKNPETETYFYLDSPEKALFIGEMLWREMFEFSKDSVLLVLASEYYDENDYIRNYEDYVIEYYKFEQKEKK